MEVTDPVVNESRLNAKFDRDCVIHTANHGGTINKASETMWKDIELLGRGQFGNVWLQQEETTGQRRAVKRVFIPPPESQKNLVRELRALIEVREYKDLFVTFIGWYEDRKFVHIVTEYVEHRSLDQYLKSSGPSSEIEAKEITRQLLAGLAVIHEKNICHRDVKPQNVLVSSKSPIHVKLADFGISKCAEGTALKTQLGTFLYMAPELQGLIGNGRVYSNVVDIWALGCLLHYILTLETPFFLASPEPSIDYERLERFCLREISLPVVALQKRSVSGEGIEFICRLLTADPGSRVSAAEALLDTWVGRVDPITVQADNGDTYIPAIRLSLGQRKDGPLAQNQPETNQPAALHPSVLPETLGLQRQTPYGEGSDSSTRSSREKFRCSHPECADNKAKAFKSESKLRDHELAHYLEKIECLLCNGNAVFSRVRRYKKHHTRVHSDTNFKATVNGLLWEGTLAQLNSIFRSRAPQAPPLGLAGLNRTIDSASSDGASDVDIYDPYSGSSRHGSEAPSVEIIDPQFLTMDEPHS